MILDAEIRKLTETDAKAFTPAKGEIVVQTDTGRIRTGDGDKLGGYEHALRTDITGGVSLDKAVQVIPQEFTAAESRQARANIGSASLADVQGTPWLAARAVVHPVTAMEPATGTPVGLDAASTSDIVTILNTGNATRSMQSGRVSQVRLYCTATVPANCQLFVECWRQNENRWRLMWRSTNVRGSVSAGAGIKSLSLGTGFYPVTTGDYFALRIVYTAASYGKPVEACSTPAQPGYASGMQCHAAFGDIGSGFDWAGGSTVLPNVSLSLQPRSSYAPQVCVLGADQGTGYPNSDSLIAPTTLWDRTADLGVASERFLALGVRETCRRGDTMANLLTRLDEDVIPAAPQICVVLASGYNDLKASRTKEAWLADLTTIINTLVAQNILCCVVSELPLYDRDALDDGQANATNLTLDQWAADAWALCRTYPDTKVLWADVRDAMGQPRDPANYQVDVWDLVDAYTEGGFYLSRQGTTALAVLIGNALKLWLRTIYAQEPQRLAVRAANYADLGDASVSLAANGFPVSVIYASTPLTQNRTITLPAASTATTQTFIRVVRTAAGPGTLTVARPAGQTPQNLVVIPSETKASVEAHCPLSYWQLTGYLALSPATGGNVIPVVTTFNVTDAAATLPSNADVLVLSSDFGWAMTSTPTIAPGVFVGQKLTVMGQHDLDEIIQLSDESLLAGSGLLLANDATRDLTAHRSLVLSWDGTEWFEESYSVPVSPVAMLSDTDVKELAKRIQSYL
jgi:hypothetical protein